MDDARKWTDSELEALERRMAKEYRQAAKEMRAKQERWLAKFDREREQREKALDDTQEAMQAHKRWLQSQATREQWFSDMVDGLSESAHRANEKAADMLNDSLPRVYAENANRAAFEVDRAVKADTGFTLVNEDAIRYLMGGMEDGQLVKEVSPTPYMNRVAMGLQSMRRDVDPAKDIRWNRQKFASAITQGILQGESIPNIVKRTESVFGQNRDAAFRAARTATTSAENAGRMRSFERAERLGIDMEIEWLATLDGRTRSSHRALDGERVKTGERFSNGCRWPGDPSGPGHEIWNCRCRANGRVVGFDGKRGDWVDEKGQRWSRLPKGMTYEQWKAGKAVSRAESYENEAGRVSGAWYAQRAADALSAPYGGKLMGATRGQLDAGSGQIKEKDLDEFNRKALASIIEETGYGERAAAEFQASIQEWLGGDFEAFARGEMQDHVRRIDDGLARMGAYDSEMFRGMHFSKSSKVDMESYQRFKNAEVGSEIRMKSVSSWTSDRGIADRYAGIGGASESVVIRCTGNKSAVGVQHLSKWGTSEAEVLAPSDTAWKVVSVREENMYDYTAAKLEGDSLSPLMKKLQAKQLAEKEAELRASKFIVIEVEEIG